MNGTTREARNLTSAFALNVEPLCYFSSLLIDQESMLYCMGHGELSVMSMHAFEKRIGSLI